MSTQQKVKKTKGKGKKKVKTTQSPKKDVSKFVNKVVTKNELAEGARANIMIIANLELGAVLGAPLGLLTMGYTRGFAKTGKIMYWAYLAYIKDLTSIMSNEISPISGRLEYLNGILATYLPKSVPFKTSSLDYSWRNVSTVTPAPAFTLRGFTYYMYEPDGGTSAGGWVTQSAPSGPAQESWTYPVLAALFTLLAKNVPMKKYVTNISYRPEYTRDVSGFATVSPYFGQGNASSSGTVSSAECEVPFRSNILANMTDYDVTDGRIARNFNTSSMDSTFAHAFGLLPEVNYNEYNTRYPVIAKFLDLDEVVYTLQYYYIGLVQQALSHVAENTITTQSALMLALQPFSYSPQQFRIAVRQVIAQMFANSWASTQFINYSGVSNSFEPCRGGSNCHPPNFDETMTIPVILNENLRFLLLKAYDVQTRFHNDKNKLFYVPVWGVIKNAPIPNVSAIFLEPNGTPLNLPMFSGDSANDPNVIDGTIGNVICDLNTSTFVPEIITEWNDRITYLQQFSGKTTKMGGEGNGVLLSMTRYAVYSTEQEIDVARLSKFNQAKLPKEYIQKRKVIRTLSGKASAPVEKEVYVPPSGSLASQFTSGYSSATVITDSVKQMLNYFIYPALVLESNNVPTASQYRTYNLEGNIVDTSISTNSIHTALSRLENYAGTMVLGLANNNGDEMTSAIDYCNDRGKGGFLSSLVSQLAPLIPF